MIKHLSTLGAAVALVVAFGGSAWAHEDPEGDGTGGAFSPKFDKSPVTVVICLTEDACPIRR